MNIFNITSYMDYLRQELNLLVSVHFAMEYFDRLPYSLYRSLLPYNSHNNPYCMAIKKNNHDKCRESQHSIRKTCKHDEGFCHICWAGVGEYIYPVCSGNNIMGIIAISGYATPNADKNISATLNQNSIPKQLCDTLIPPLAVMFERFFEENSVDKPDELNRILQFLSEYHTHISVYDIARHFGRSVSHISHMFKTKTGFSISEYCNNLKLDDAKRLLRKTDFSVTKIALDVGFSDVSYFILLFRKRFGKSPLQYRKQT